MQKHLYLPCDWVFVANKYISLNRFKTECKMKMTAECVFSTLCLFTFYERAEL